MPTTNEPEKQAIGIIADDPRLEQRIRRLEQQVSEAGGVLNPALTAVVEGGEIRVESDAPPGDTLVRLPPESLVPVADNTLGIEGNDLVVRDDTGLSMTQRDLLEGMLGIFNATGKLNQQQTTLPWLALADERALLELLHQGRLHAPKPSRYFELLHQENHRQLLLDSFLGSRTLGFRATPDSEAQPVLMPFIDFFNHHAGSPPFARSDGGLGVRCSRPLAESNQCFVRYNRMDSLDAYLNYGFADRSARFVRSVPVRVVVDGVGEIDIRARVAQPRAAPLPKAMEHLTGFVPRFQKTSAHEVVAAELLVPTFDVHRILGGALGIMLRNLDAELDGSRLVAALESAVAQVLEANIAFYKALDAKARAVAPRKHARPAFGELDALLKHQAGLLLTVQNALTINPGALNGVNSGA